MSGLSAALRRIQVVDSHTAGEPTRVIVAGGPDLGNGDLPQKLVRLRAEHDWLRLSVVGEPRGSDVVVGALLCEPSHASYAAAVIFFNDVGYLGMCGHGTIGVVTTLAHLERIGPGRHTIETPVGCVVAELSADGSVSFDNVPSYLYRANVPLDVPGFGSFCGDIAWGGNWFYLVSDQGFALHAANRSELMTLSTAMRAALVEAGITGKDGEPIEHIELCGPPELPGNSGRNFVLCPGTAFDRSPCGTGTSAKLASLHATGKLALNMPWRQEGILGTVFEGVIRAAKDGYVIPTITGRAWITAESTLLFDATDPLPPAFLSKRLMYDVIIIGAGIIGCCCAQECAEAGLRVALIERGVPGGATTAAGMGHVVVMDDSPAQLALSHFSRSLWQKAVDHLPRTVEYEARGTLWVAADEQEMAEVHAKHEAFARAGIASAVLNSAALVAKEPNLRPNLAGALLVPDDAVVYPPTAAAFFLQQAVAAGAVLLRGQPVERAGEGEVRLADGTLLHSPSIVLATGTDISLLPSLPIQKRKGHLLITDRYPGLLNHQVVELGYLKSAHTVVTDSVACNIQPRQTGQLLIGSSRQYGQADPAIDQALFRSMLERACSYMPVLAHVSGIRAWTGFRAATPDKLPLIGPTADATIFLAVGFEGLGITNAPGAARILADQLLHRVSSIDIEPYLPARLSLKEAAHA